MELFSLNRHHQLIGKFIGLSHHKDLGRTYQILTMILNFLIYRLGLLFKLYHLRYFIMVKALILNFSMLQLICTFVFAPAKSRFSPDAAHNMAYTGYVHQNKL